MFVFKTPPPDFFPEVQVAGCYCECQDKLLLLKRSSHKSQANTWGIPGGKLEEGETPIHCIIRELFEETKLALPLEQLSYIAPVFVKLPIHHFIFHLFRIPFENFPNAITLNDENEEFKWVTLEEAYALPLMLGADECLNFVYKSLSLN